jgi:hypothetical protein
MNVIIQFRRGTAAEWAAANPTLALGEVGYETDTKKIKVGNGSSAWNSLEYSAPDIADLAGVNLSSASAGDVLTFDGETWVPQEAAASYPKGGGNDKVFLEHSYTVTEDYTITSGHHAITAGPLEIAEGVTVTVPEGSNWLVL